MILNIKFKNFFQNLKVLTLNLKVLTLCLKSPHDINAFLLSKQVYKQDNKQVYKQVLSIRAKKIFLLKTFFILISI